MITFERCFNFSDGSQRQITFRRMDFHVKLMGTKWFLFARHQIQLPTTRRFIGVIAHVAASWAFVAVILVTWETIAFQEIIVTVAGESGEKTFRCHRIDEEFVCSTMVAQRTPFYDCTGSCNWRGENILISFNAGRDKCWHLHHMKSVTAPTNILEHPVCTLPPSKHKKWIRKQISFRNGLNQVKLSQSHLLG